MEKGLNFEKKFKPSRSNNDTEYPVKVVDKLVITFDVAFDLLEYAPVSF